MSEVNAGIYCGRLSRHHINSLEFLALKGLFQSEALSHSQFVVVIGFCGTAFCRSFSSCRRLDCGRLFLCCLADLFAEALCDHIINSFAYGCLTAEFHIRDLNIKFILKEGCDLGVLNRFRVEIFHKSLLSCDTFSRYAKESGSSFRELCKDFLLSLILAFRSCRCCGRFLCGRALFVVKSLAEAFFNYKADRVTKRCLTAELHVRDLDVELIFKESCDLGILHGFCIAVFHKSGRFRQRRLIFSEQLRRAKSKFLEDILSDAHKQLPPLRLCCDNGLYSASCTLGFCVIKQ